MKVLFLLLLPAVLCDIRTFRIPNELIVVGVLVGSGYRLCHPGEMTFLYYLLSMAAMFILLIPFFKLRAIGGGDVKLLSLCGLIQGFGSALSIALYAFFFGGILSVFYLVYHRFFSTQKTKERHIIPFSIPVFLGVVTEQFWGGVLWQIF